MNRPHTPDPRTLAVCGPFPHARAETVLWTCPAASQATQALAGAAR